MDRVAWCIFCDDIRTEHDNKHTFVGVWNAKLHFREFPASIPALGMAVHIRSAVNDPVGRLIIEVRGNEIELDLDINMTDLSRDVPSDAPESTAIVLARIPNVTIPSPTRLTVSVRTERENLYAGSVLLELQPELQT